MIEDSPEYRVLCSSRDREAWLRFRRVGIGASDMAAVMGVGRWGSPMSVYADKRGATVDDPEKEWMAWGRRLEPLIIAHFAELHEDRIVVPAGDLLQSSEHPWAVCTLDAHQSTPDELAFPLEVKTARVKPDGIPLDYRIQMHHQMLVTGTRSSSFAVLVAGAEFYERDVSFDENLAAEIVKAGEAFWERVQEGRPPAPDGHAATARAIKALYPEDDGTSVVLPRDFVDLADERERIQYELGRLDGEKAEIDNQIKAAIGDHSVGVLTDTRSFTYRANKNGVRSLRAREESS